MTPEGYAALPYIYDAATNMRNWKRALDAAGRSIGSRAIALTIRRRDLPVKDLYMLSSRYLEFSRSIPGMYYGLWLSRLQKGDWDFLSRQQVHVPVADTAMGFEPEELDRRRDYAFLRKKLAVSRRVGVRLNADCVWFDAMSIAFDKNIPEVPQASLVRTIDLLPHITKSVEIGRTFSVLKAKHNAVLAALDRVQIGMAIALASGEVVVSNSEAERILALADGLTLTREKRLATTDPGTTAKIGKAIKDTCLTAIGEGTASEYIFPISRASGDLEFLVDVSPLKDSLKEIDPSFHGALITIIDPRAVPVPKVDRFARLYQLTAAETEVLSHLINGDSLEEIAEQRGTSPITARNQIASILNKTDSPRRADLIRLVIRVMPPID